jgi:hypothetical protein
VSDSAFDKSEAQLVPGTLRGYRGWRLIYDTLLALSWDIVWQGKDPGPALCLHNTRHPHYGPRRAPEAGCSCGYWAYYNPAHLDKINQYLTPANVHVTGSISAHGKVILGTVGFKAERVVVEALCLQNPASRAYPSAAELTAERYELPLFVRYEEMLEAFPPVDVSELVGPSPEPPTYMRPNPYLGSFWSGAIIVGDDVDIP